jgi:hypothetical protein
MGGRLGEGHFRKGLGRKARRTHLAKVISGKGEKEDKAAAGDVTNSFEAVKTNLAVEASCTEKAFPIGGSGFLLNKTQSPIPTGRKIGQSPNGLNLF